MFELPPYFLRELRVLRAWGPWIFFVASGLMIGAVQLIEPQQAGRPSFLHHVFAALAAFWALVAGNCRLDQERVEETDALLMATPFHPASFLLQIGLGAGTTATVGVLVADLVAGLVDPAGPRLWIGAFLQDAPWILVAGAHGVLSMTLPRSVSWRIRALIGLGQIGMISLLFAVWFLHQLASLGALDGAAIAFVAGAITWILLYRFHLSMTDWRVLCSFRDRDEAPDMVGSESMAQRRLYSFWCEVPAGVCPLLWRELMIAAPHALLVSVLGSLGIWFFEAAGRSLDGMAFALLCAMLGRTSSLSISDARSNFWRDIGMTSITPRRIVLTRVGVQAVGAILVAALWILAASLAPGSRVFEADAGCRSLTLALLAGIPLMFGLIHGSVPGPRPGFFVAFLRDPMDVLLGEGAAFLLLGSSFGRYGVDPWGIAGFYLCMSAALYRRAVRSVSTV